MSNNFYTVSVFVGHTPGRKRQAIVERIRSFALAQGLNETNHVNRADAVVRISRSVGGWVTIQCEGVDVEQIALALGFRRKWPIVFAYCEASAIVNMTLMLGRQYQGTWQANGDETPADSVVQPLLVKGTARELADAFDKGLREVFPETALAIACDYLGLNTDNVFGARSVGATRLCFTRKLIQSKLKKNKGPVAWNVQLGSNHGLNGAHLVFDGYIHRYRAILQSIGGRGRGLRIECTGPLVTKGAVDIVSVEAAWAGGKTIELVHSGQTWENQSEKIVAGVDNCPDLWELPDRQRKRLETVLQQREIWVDLVLMPKKEITGPLELNVYRGAELAGHAELLTTVAFRPYEPMGSIEKDPYSLFAMHREDFLYGVVTFREAGDSLFHWLFEHLWGDVMALLKGQSAKLLNDKGVIEHYSREGSNSGEYEQFWERVKREIGKGHRGLRLIAENLGIGPVCQRGHQADSQDQEPVWQLWWTAQNDSENKGLIGRFETICDVVIRERKGYSALMGAHQYPNQWGPTPWERLVMREELPLAEHEWHRNHIRGLDRRGIWLSEDHTKLITLEQLPVFVEVTGYDWGAKLRIADDAPRRRWIEIESVMGPILPAS